MTMSGNIITIVLGAPSGSVRTVTMSGTLRWTPKASALDLAGNNMSTTTRDETGANHREL
jgi:hypothetical protein